MPDGSLDLTVADIVRKPAEVLSTLGSTARYCLSPKQDGIPKPAGRELSDIVRSDFMAHAIAPLRQYIEGNPQRDVIYRLLENPSVFKFTETDFGLIFAAYLLKGTQFEDIFKPHLAGSKQVQYYRGIHDIPWDSFYPRYSAVILDAGNCLVPPGLNVVQQEYIDLVAHLVSVGWKVAILSNSHDGFRMPALRSQLGTPGFLADPYKPDPQAHELPLAEIGYQNKRDATLTVGDRLRDIVAGNLAGVSTILVDQLKPTNNPLVQLEHWVVLGDSPAYTS